MSESLLLETNFSHFFFLFHFMTPTCAPKASIKYLYLKSHFNRCLGKKLLERLSRITEASSTCASLTCKKKNNRN